MINKFLVSLIIVFGFLGCATKQTNIKKIDAKPVSEIKVNKSFLWQVKSDTTTVYLMGSIHFMKQDMYPLKPEIEEAYEKSSILVVELDTTAVDQAQMQRLVFEKGMLKNNQTIKDVLSTDVYAMLESTLNELQIPISAVEKFKPGMLAITLSSMKIVNLGFSPKFGLDVYFINKAKEHKQIIELETIGQQLSLIFDEINGDLLLKQTLTDLDGMEKGMDQIVSIWEKAMLI